MEKRIASAFSSLIFLFMLIGDVYAADQSFVDQFIGSPLIILVILLVIDVIAVVYRRLRK